MFKHQKYSFFLEIQNFHRMGDEWQLFKCYYQKMHRNVIFSLTKRNLPLIAHRTKTHDLSMKIVDLLMFKHRFFFTKDFNFKKSDF